MTRAVLIPNGPAVFPCQAISFLTAIVFLGTGGAASYFRSRSPNSVFLDFLYRWQKIPDNLTKGNHNARMLNSCQEVHDTGRASKARVRRPPFQRTFNGICSGAYSPFTSSLIRRPGVNTRHPSVPRTWDILDTLQPLPLFRPSPESLATWR